MIFTTGTIVITSHGRGIVWKVTDKAVHIRYDDGYFQKFFFKPKHHMQTSISELIKEG